MKAQSMNFISVSSADEAGLYQYVGNVLANSSFDHNQKMSKGLGNLGAMIRNERGILLSEVQELIYKFVRSEDNDIDPFENDGTFRESFSVTHWLEYSKLELWKKKISADLDIEEIAIHLFNTQFSDVYNPLLIVNQITNLAILEALVVYLSVYPQQQMAVLVLAKDGNIVASQSVTEGDENKKQRYDDIINQAIELGVCTKEDIEKLNEGIDNTVEFADIIKDGKSREVRYAEVNNKAKEDIAEYVEENIKLTEDELRDLTPEEEEACSRALYELSEGTGVNLY